MLEDDRPAESSEPAVHRAIADALLARGEALGAEAHRLAAHALDSHSAGRSDEALAELCKVAIGYSMLGEIDAAERWYRLILSLDPNQAAALQNLAAIHDERGETARARACRDRAYRIQRVFIEAVAAPWRHVLVLCAGGAAANVPMDALLSSGRSSRIKYVIDHAADDEDARLPPFDLVFNAIGEPDAAAALAARLARFVARCRRPLLNAPTAVVRTQRHRLGGLLGMMADVDVPACARFDEPPASRVELQSRLRRCGLEMPILVRPAASHGGKGLVRCDDIEALAHALRGIDGAHHLTAFRDYRSPDGSFRKYRVVFVDRRPYAYHLAVSSQWMVHYFSADMLADRAKLADERRFLYDMPTVLGRNAMAAIVEIGKRLDLDYCGIDFALLADGRVLVFEANATMLVHFERASGPLAHRNAFVQRIVDAFEALQASRLAGWRAS